MLSRFSLGTVLAAAALAQAPMMPELPKGPAKPGFDIFRFALTAVGTFQTFYVTETYPLKKVLDEGRVALTLGFWCLTRRRASSPCSPTR